MIFSLFAADLYEALNLLEQFETKSAKGVMAVPFYAINRINFLLEQAVDHGDCYAPYFLHYMHEKYSGSKEIENELLDLNKVPSHRARGSNFLEAYKLYLDIVKTSEGGKWTFKSIKGAAHARLVIRALDRGQSAFEKVLQNKINRLAEIDIALSPLFLGMIAEKSDYKEIISLCYKEAAFKPNLWAMRKYWNFLQNNPTYCDATDVHYVVLKNDMENILNSPDKSYKDLLVYYNLELEKNLSTEEMEMATRRQQQWTLHSHLHGEHHDPFSFAQVYAQLNTQWVLPISSSDSLLEALKWFDWIVDHKDSKLGQFNISLILSAKALMNKKNPIYEELALLLKICAYVHSNGQDFMNCYVETEVAELNFLELILARWEEVAQKIYDHNSKADILSLNEHILVRIALNLEKKKDYKKAEEWYRKALSMKPDAITLYNVANILLKQKKGYQESVALFLKAAVQGCNDSVSALLGMHVIQKVLSLQDLNALIAIVKNRMPVGTILKDKGEQLFLLSDWLKNEYEKKLLKVTFKNWKNGAIKILKTKAAASVIALIVEEKDEDTDVEDDTPNTQQVDYETLVEAGEEGEEILTPEAVNARLKRAIDRLEDLSKKRMRNLTIRDRLDVQKYLKIIMGEDPSIEVSTKGKTSGSRFLLGADPVHLPHGHDTMSPGAQQEVKRIVAAAAAQSRPS